MSTHNRIKPIPLSNMPTLADYAKSLPDYAKVLEGISQGLSQSKLGPPHKLKKRGPKVRVVRVIEYVGEYEAVRECIEKSVREKTLTSGVIIKGTTLGAVPEILNPQETKRLRAKLKAEKVKNKLLDDGTKDMFDEFTWQGISRQGGQIGGSF